MQHIVTGDMFYPAKAKFYHPRCKESLSPKMYEQAKMNK